MRCRTQLKLGLFHKETYYVRLQFGEKSDRNGKLNKNRETMFIR